MSLVLSALDQSVSLAGSSEDAAIRDSVSLAAHCEAEGYHRFWLSEHHALPTIIGTAPEVLMAAVAATIINAGSNSKRVIWQGIGHGASIYTACALPPVIGYLESGKLPETDTFCPA